MEGKLPYNGSLERLRGFGKSSALHVISLGIFSIFFLSWQVFVSSGFRNFFLFFFMTALIYLSLHFSNGLSIAVKPLLANLLVHVITYSANITNMYIEYKWCKYKVNIGCFNLVYNCFHPAIFVPFYSGSLQMILLLKRGRAKKILFSVSVLLS